jgi:hypothetical protein
VSANAKKRKPRPKNHISNESAKQVLDQRESKRNLWFGVTGLAVGVVGLVVAAITLWPTFRSTELGEEGQQIDQNADLSFVRVDMSSTEKLRQEIRMGGEQEHFEVAEYDTPAAKIVLQNKGGQPAFVEKVDVEVSKVWALMGCHGAGAAVTSTIYDFILPGDIDSVSFPLKLSKDVDFVVQPKSDDRLAITVGEESVGETGWSWITAAKASLVLSDGSEVHTSPFILMNSSEIDHIVDLVQWGLANDAVGSGRTECVQANIGMLEQALKMDAGHSPSIEELVGRLKEIGFTSTSAPSPPSQEEPSGTIQAADPYLNSWVAMLGSYPEATTSESDLAPIISQLEQKTGGEIHKIRSATYSSLTSGYWVLFHDGRFNDGHEALAFCSTHGFTAMKSCAGRYFSNTAEDRELSCEFSDPPDAPNCIKH